MTEQALDMGLQAESRAAKAVKVGHVTRLRVTGIFANMMGRSNSAVSQLRRFNCQTEIDHLRITSKSKGTGTTNGGDSTIE